MSHRVQFRRVYLTQHVPAHSYRDLRLMGRALCPVFTRSMFPDQSDAARDLYAEAIVKLADFDAARDVLALDGDFIGMIMCATVLARNFNTFHVAKYDQKLSGYYVVPIGSSDPPTLTTAEA